MKYYTPLPWIHLAESLRPSQTHVRIVFDTMLQKDSKCLAQLFFGNADAAVTDPYRLLESNVGLSVRQKSCIKVFAHADPFSVKRDRFVLGPQQLATLLLFANDVTLEVKGVGAINPSPEPALIKAELFALEDSSPALRFVATDFSGHLIDSPSVIGVEEAYLLDEHLCLYRLEPPLLPAEALALLNTQPLAIHALGAEEAQTTFAAIAELGIDLSCLTKLAKNSDPTAQITLRAILNPSNDTTQISLRIHLVTSLGYAGQNDEVEIPARGALAPVFPVCSDRNRALSHEERELHLIARPNDLEEDARRFVFSLSAVSASAHRGFKAEGQRALDVLAKIAKREHIPSWLHVDDDMLGRVINLPEIPSLSLKTSELSLNELIVQLHLDNDTDIDFSLDNLLKIAQDKGSALLVNDDTVITFSRSAGESLAVLSDSLDLHTFKAKKTLNFFEAALLFSALKNHINIVCHEDLKKRLVHFVPDVLPQDQTLPKTLQTALRPYQHDAVTWMSQLHRAGLGRLLADDMGLGKTLMVLTLLAKIKEQAGSMPSLVVAPTSVIDVWVQEAQRHFADLKVIKWHGATRLEQMDEAKNADIVVTSYALLRRDIDSFLATLSFRYLILDEAQNIKNPRTESWKAARAVKSEQRLALTGTPIENRILDLYSIIELVAPSVLGSERNFSRRYVTPISAGNADRVVELRERLRPIILRRKKIDVESDLPPKIESVLRAEMLPDQRGLYRRILEAAHEELKGLLQGDSGPKAQLPLLAALTRLRQVCCDPRLVLADEHLQISSAKANLFVEVLNECVSMGRRIIVYSQFVKMQRIIHELLKQNGINNALWLHGGTRDRADVVRKFQDPEGPSVIVVSLKAGGTGVTLTAADTVIYYDPWWNPAVLDQAADRAHRIGQTKTVHLIKLICENSIEEQILALSEKKREMAEDMLTADKPGQRSLTLDEIKRLLSVELDRIRSSDF